MSYIIRKVQHGDAKYLAYIQTNSWNTAFAGIVPDDVLEKCTEIAQIESMYSGLLNENKGNGYILEVDGQPHCMAYWDASREGDMPGYAEIICIHSLQDKWHQGYGSKMMEHLLSDIHHAGFSKVMLWVFEKNTRAVNFYKKHGFSTNGRHQESFGAIEVMYEKWLSD